MFTKKTPAEKSGLELAIESVLLDMQQHPSDHPAYAKMTDQLDKLYNLKPIDKPERVSKDTLALIGGNLAAVVLVVGYERANIVTTKALSFILKAR